MKQFLRSQLERRAPALFNGIYAIRNRQYFRRTLAPFQSIIRRELFPDHRPILVQTGPFRGLCYLDETVWGSITPKWLGSYEAELHPVIAAIVERAYATIIDVGCAEGYYAVGLAVAMPKTKVIAFDTDFISRGQIRRLAKLNQVTERVRVETFCQHSDLDACSDANTLVVCDIEGFESHLLNPEAAGCLLKNDVLVEVHETSDSSLATERLLQSRFSKSHRIERIAATGRESWIADHRKLFDPALSPDTLVKATDESRAVGRVWLWMQANRSNPGTP